jgi:hypothetical protein
MHRVPKKIVKTESHEMSIKRYTQQGVNKYANSM